MTTQKKVEKKCEVCGTENDLVALYDTVTQANIYLCVHCKNNLNDDSDSEKLEERNR